MKKIKWLLSVMALVLALAGETVLLLRAHERYVQTQRQAYAGELSEEILTLSASLRMGEAEHFDEALARYSATEEKILPFLTSEEQAKLSDYSTALGAPETRALLNRNELYIKLNTLLKDGEKLSEAESLLDQAESLLDQAENQPELTKLKDALHELEGCKVYCSSENYREIEKTLKDEAEKLKQSTTELEQENTERLGSEAMLEWLDMLK